MNKIYKVVWSKAKYCYVVTSELAKRQTKGCGARSLRMATVSLGVAAALLCSGAVLPIFGESVAEAASSYKISGTVEKDGVTKSFTEANFVESSGSQRDYGYGNQFFESGEATNAQNYHTTITSAPNWRMFVGAGIDVGTVSGNTVTVNGDSTNITQSVIGGYAIGSATKTDESLVTQNEVIINAGTYYDVYGATMGMYYAAPGKATDNTVTINGGMVKGYVWGGDGDVSDSNKVYIKGGTVKPLNTGKKVFGGSGVKEATNNEVYISGGTVGTEKENATNGYTGDISGGYSWSGKADGNKISVTGGTVHAILYGGKNSTESVRNDYSAVGGDSPVEHTTLTGTVSNNEVQISGGTVNGNVYGGMGAVSASGNTVTIKENAVLGKDVEVYGGTAMAKYSTTTYTYTGSVWEVNTSVDKVEYGDVTNNTVNIGNFINSSANDYIYVYGGKVGGNDDATSTKKVNVSNNTVTVDANNSTISYVYGGVIGGKANGDVKENKVEIKSGTVYGVFGGLTTVGDATGNSVSVIDGDVKFYYGGILGGSSENGDAIDNTVTISGGSLVNTAGVKIIGGSVLDADHSATSNQVIISNGTIGSNEGSQYENGFYVIAGDASERGGNATDNTITISGGSFASQNTFEFYGGKARNIYTSHSETGEVITATAAADDNTVEISGGSFSENVKIYGAYSSATSSAISGMDSKATLTGTVNENTVKISDGTFSGNVDVYGGYGTASAGAYGTGEIAVATVAANGNTVEISGGTFSGNVNVYGGYGHADGTSGSGGGTATSSASADNNEVIISGGTINGYIAGGWATESASGNTVTIKDNAVIGENARIYGGYAASTVTFGTAANNTVNILKSVKAGALIGGLGDETKSTGNTLNLGAADVQATDSVADFQTISFTNALPWDNGKTVLAANNFDGDESFKAELDISAASNLTAATSGQMTLLASETDNDLNALSVKYDGGTAALDTTTTSVKVKDSTSSDDNGSGVVLNTQSTHTVSLDAANSYKNVIYKVDVDGATGLTFGAMTWVEDGTGRTSPAGLSYAAVTDDSIDTTGLQFSNPEAVAPNTTMTLLSDAENLAAGTNRDHTQTFDYELSNAVSLNATLSGTVVRTTANEIGYQAVGTAVNKVDLAGWDGNEATFDATGWTLAKDNTDQVTATVETDGMDVSAITPGTEKTVLMVTGVDLTGIKVVGEYEYKANGESIAETTDHASGVTITTGTTTGGGVKVADSNAHQLIYQKDKKTVTEITLGSVAYEKDGTARAFDSTYDLTNAEIIATGFSLSNGVTATMNAGDTMVVVDATQAIKGTGTATLKDFATKTMGPLNFSDDISGTVLTFAGKHTDTLEQNSDKTQIVYKVGDKNVETVTLDGSVTWNDSKAYYTNDAAKYKFNSATAVTVNVADLKVAGSTDKLLKADGSSSMTLLSATGMTAGTFTDQSEANKAASKVSVNYKDGQGVAFKAEAKGAVATEPGAVKYKINEVKLTDVDLSGWTGSESSVPDTWTAEDGSVKVAAGSFAEPEVAVGSSRTIMTASGAFFDDANISGANKYDAANGKAFSETKSNVTVSGTQAKGVATADGGKSLIYKADIKKADTVTLGSVNWQKDAVLFDGSSATEYDYAAVMAIGTDKFDVTYAAPEKVAAGESMTLLKANETLTAIVNEEKEKAYSFTPVSGVTVDAAITGKLINSENNVVFTAAANQASKLTFGDVEWKDSGALLTRPSNITFAGADVDTTKINFTNMIYLDADRQMTLVSDFGDKVGTITGSKYRVGTAFEGEGAASLSGKDLIFRTKTGAGVSEQTHKTVMATEAGVTALTVGNDYMSKALDGMGDVANVSPDGSTVGAAIGGGKNRYETGSHVNVNSWNAAVAVGAKREMKNGSLEYGVFGEYGKANFTLHSDAGRGDGDARYAGGGLVAKWTNKHDVYTEASFRLGRLSESSSDIMRDGLGNTYGYDVHANYYGAHVGVGKIFRYNGGRSLDVYGKYFYTKRNGVEFDAVQHYNLDSVASSVLRIGARYGTTDKKWNWYGGLAYEYEFDGEAEGVVNGVAIRAASIKGSSVRGEIGLRMNATKTNPWQTDISIYGYGGKHRGFGGNVNVAYMF